MNQFAEYQKLRQNEQTRNAFIDQQKTRGLAQKKQFGGDFPLDFDTVQTQAEERAEQTNFAVQSEYYFQNADLLDAKVERYRRLQNDESGAVQEYAKQHSYRSANKRKKRAKKAANHFEQAAKLSRSVDESTLQPMEVYQHRKEIMQLRMAAMEEAAKAKATSKKNEAYRISKAKYSCLMVLRRQLNELKKKKGQNPDSIAREEQELERNIASALRNMQKSIPSAESRWEEEHSDKTGMFSKAKLDASYQENHQKQPAFTKEDNKLFLKLSNVNDSWFNDLQNGFETIKQGGAYNWKPGDESRILGNFLRPVYRDKNGMPLNEAERQKDAWNHRVVDILSSKERTKEKDQLIQENFDRIMKYEFPTPQQIQEKGLAFFVQKDPAKYFELTRCVLTIDNVLGWDPTAQKYYDEHPEFVQKHNALALLADQVKNILSYEHSICSSKDSKQHFVVDTGEREEVDKESFYQDYQTELDRIPKVKQMMKTNPAIAGSSILKIWEAQKYSRIYDDPELQASVERARAKKVFRGTGETVELSRGYATILRDHMYDKQGRPQGKDSDKNHAWNLKWVKAVEDEDFETQKEMVEEELPKMADPGFKIPAPEEVTPEWIQHLIKKDFKQYISYKRKALAFSNLIKANKPAKEYLNQHPDLDAQMDAMTDLINTIDAYTKGTTCVDFQVGGNTVRVVKPAEQQAFMELFKPCLENYQKTYKAWKQPAGNQAS